MKKPDSAIQFPCSYPLKAMGLNTETVASAITAILEKHAGHDQVSYSRRVSSGGKYVSITATFTARSRDQLDALYQELNDSELVLMTL